MIIPYNPQKTNKLHQNALCLLISTWHLLMLWMIPVVWLLVSTPATGRSPGGQYLQEKQLWSTCGSFTWSCFSYEFVRISQDVAGSPTIRKVGQTSIPASSHTMWLGVHPEAKASAQGHGHSKVGSLSFQPHACAARVRVRFISLRTLEETLSYSSESLRLC